MAKEQYENIRRRLFVEVCNAEKYQKALESLVYEPRENLAVVYRLNGYDEDIGIENGLVTKEQMERWGVGVEKLSQDAWANTKEKHPPAMISLTDNVEDAFHHTNLLGDSIPSPQCVSATDAFGLINPEAHRAAAYMFDDETMHKAAEKLGVSLYVLPSSVSEAVIVPDCGEDVQEELREILRYCNANEGIMTEEEFLSDEIFYYDRELHTISMAAIQERTENMEEPEAAPQAMQTL